RPRPRPRSAVPGEPPRRSLEFLDGQVAERDLGLAVAVDLEPDEAVLLEGFVGLGVVDGLDAVDRQPDALSLAPDLVRIPFAGLLGLLDEFGIGLGERLVAPRLVVEGAGHARADVGLVPAHLIRRLRD